jgi:NTE family protein
MPSREVSLVLSGGVALGAYQAGAYAALHDHEDLRPRRLAGSSIGAVNAAVIAGNPSDERVGQLRAFWDALTVEPGPFQPPWLGPWREGPWRHAHSWMSVVQTRLFGRIGVFQPRIPEMLTGNVTSLYDLAPFRGQLERFIDFDRVNGNDPRVTVVTTDVESGQAVVFDTGRGDRIGPDHLLATCGFLPDFPPVEIDGRLLGDGCLVANAPFEAALLDAEDGADLVCFAVDLYSPEGARPTTLEEAATRRWDLLFGNQSRERLECLEREYRLRSALGRMAARLGPEHRKDPELERISKEGIARTLTLLHLSYRAPIHEAGPEKAFDFSRESLADRWETGFHDMAEAVRIAADRRRPRAGISVHRVRR